MNPLLLFNGFKTLIGLVVLGVGGVMALAGADDGKTVMDIGAAIAGIGALHQSLKKGNQSPESPELTLAVPVAKKQTEPKRKK